MCKHLGCLEGSSLSSLLSSLSLLAILVIQRARLFDGAVVNHLCIMSPVFTLASFSL